MGLDAGSLDLVAHAGRCGGGCWAGRAGDGYVGADAEGGGGYGLVHDLGLFGVHGIEDVGGNDAVGPLVHVEDATVSGNGQICLLLVRDEREGYLLVGQQGTLRSEAVSVEGL